MLSGWVAGSIHLFGPKALGGSVGVRQRGPWGTAAALTDPGRSQPTHSSAHNCIIPYKDLNSPGRPRPSPPAPPPFWRDDEVMRRCYWSEGAAPKLPRGWVPLAPLYHSATLDLAHSGQRAAASAGKLLPPLRSGSRAVSRRPLAGSADSCSSHSKPLRRVPARPAGLLGGHFPGAQSCPACTVRPGE